MTETTDVLSNVLQSLRLSAGLFTEAALCGAWAVNTAGQRMSTFHLVQSGDSWLQQGDDPPRRLRPGDFVLFPRDAKHLITSSETLSPSVVVNDYPPIDPDLPLTEMLCGYFEFQSKMVWPLLDSLPEVLVIDLHRAPSSDTRALVQLLMGESRGRQPGHQAAIDRLIEVLFVHALRTYMESGVSAGLLKLFADPKLGRALGQLHRAPGKRWSVASLAKAAGMSRASFSQKFRDAIDDTPMNYLSKWRMQMAVDALTTSDRSVAAIAEDVGYGSEAAFRHAFRQVVGVTPGQVRKRDGG